MSRLASRASVLSTKTETEEAEDRHKTSRTPTRGGKRSLKSNNGSTYDWGVVLELFLLSRDGFKNKDVESALQLGTHF